MALQFFFYFFTNILCIFAIFDFFSKTMSQIVLKPGGNVPCGRVTQVCSVGSIAVDPLIFNDDPVIFGFLMIFLLLLLHAYYRSMHTFLLITV